MRRVLPRPRFFKAYKHAVKKNPTLQRLSEDQFHQSLETHKLKGALAGVWACNAAYDSRILFEFVANEPEDDLLLINIGTHDDVY